MLTQGRTYYGKRRKGKKEGLGSKHRPMRRKRAWRQAIERKQKGERDPGEETMQPRERALRRKRRYERQDRLVTRTLATRCAYPGCDSSARSTWLRGSSISDYCGQEHARWMGWKKEEKKEGNSDHCGQEHARWMGQKEEEKKEGNSDHCGQEHARWMGRKEEEKKEGDPKMRRREREERDKRADEATQQNRAWADAMIRQNREWADSDTGERGG
jgi:hypothetical protein